MSNVPGRDARLRRVFLSTVLTAAFLYVLAAGLMWLLQRDLMYLRGSLTLGQLATSYKAPEMKTVAVTTADGLHLAAWYAPSLHKGGEVIIFFHGSGGIVLVAQKAQLFMKRGYGVFLCEYRGYAGNPGEPAEQGLYADARAALAWLNTQGYKPGQWVLYDESLGSGVAVQMAVENKADAVILEAPYASAAAVAKLQYPFLPVDLLMKDRFDSIDKIGKIQSPLLVLHGTADGMIPFAQGQSLFEAAPNPKTFHEFKGGGHVDLYQYHAGDVVAAWLDKVTNKAGQESRHE